MFWLAWCDGASQKERYANDDRLVLDRLRSLGRWDGKPMMLQMHLMSSHALGKRFDDVPESRRRHPQPGVADNIRIGRVASAHDP